MTEWLEERTESRLRRGSLSSMAAVWKRDGVFTVSLSSFTGVLRDAARAAGFSAIYVHLDHTAYAEENTRELVRIRPRLEQDGWVICGWATYGQDTDPASDGAAAANIARNLGLAGWVANGEDWAEGDGKSDSRKFLGEWNYGGAPCPVAVSCLSSETGNYARDFDFDAWLAQPGAAILPQVYTATHRNLTVDACLRSLTKTSVTVNRLALTFDNGAPTTGWNGPRSIWTGDQSTVEQWRALSR